MGGERPCTHSPHKEIERVLFACYFFVSIVDVLFPLACRNCRSTRQLLYLGWCWRRRCWIGCVRVEDVLENFHEVSLGNAHQAAVVVLDPHAYYKHGKYQKRHNCCNTGGQPQS
ncbi:hypothetical protein GQ600_25252 [Phytophthora cactorum]|nr:hypothetical protein GQ600_10833 [Phytophthora cactorum]KAF1788912.1 hypothetical protein GQ600_25252 [Phytophthora cactorum]